MATKQPPQIQRQKVESSNVRSIGYDPRTKTLEVEFKRGAVYQYSGVPQWRWDEFDEQSSVGKWVSQDIVPNYSSTKIKENDTK